MDKIHYNKLKEIIESDSAVDLNTYIEKEGIDINDNFSTTNTQKDSLLFYAVRKNKDKCVSHLLSYPEIIINNTNNNNITPLMHCITFNKEDLFNALIQHKSPGLQIRDNENSQLYPLARAVQRGNFDMVKAIVKHPENSWARSENSPLFQALSTKKTKIGLFLIENKEFDPYVLMVNTYPYNYALRDLNTKVVNAIINLEGFNPNLMIKKNDEDMPLWWNNFIFLSKSTNTNTNNYADKLFKLLKSSSKVDLNAKDSKGKTLLQNKTTPDNTATFNLLIKEKKVDIHVLNDKGQTILEKLLLMPLDRLYDSKDITEKVNLVVKRIIEENTHIPFYMEKLEKLNIDSPLLSWAQTHFRNKVFSEKIIEKKETKDKETPKFKI